MRKFFGLAMLVLFVILPAGLSKIVIQQVLYDPFGAESGGEAVQLFNTGESAVDVSNWALATEASARDAVLPEGTVLAPGSTFLVADTGWNASKDNPDWGSADYEETLTLGNTDSGVALKGANGTVIDAVGWGNAENIKAGLFEGSPALPVEEGQALLRVQDTGENSEDFIAAEPMFAGRNSVLVEVSVGSGSVRILADDDPAPGVQVLPFAGQTRKVLIDAPDNVVLEFQGRRIENKTLEMAHTMLPGEYEVFADGNVVAFTVLPLSAFQVVTPKVLLRGLPGNEAEGMAKVRNLGNVPVRVAWKVPDIVNGNARIAKERVSIAETELGVGEENDVLVVVRVPENAVPGTYRAVLRAMTA